MNPPAQMVFTGRELCPPRWRNGHSIEQCRVFNPAIVMFRGRLLMTYRVLTTPARKRIAICELDPALRIKPETVTPLSDSIHGAGHEYGDTRLLVHQDRLFAHCSDASGQVPNFQFLFELDAGSLVAKTPARPFVVQGARRPIDKNWALFDHEGDLYAVYTIRPHVIYQVDLRFAERVQFCPMVQSEWWDLGYTWRYGEPRGGAPPARRGDAYYVFFHSWHWTHPLERIVRALARRAARWRRPQLRLDAAEIAALVSAAARAGSPSPEMGRNPPGVRGIRTRVRYRFDRRRYVGGCYSFAAAPPFRPMRIVPQPVLSAVTAPAPRQPPVNPAAERVAFPCGAIAWPDDSWLVSYGVDDEHCAVSVLDHRELVRTARPVTCDLERDASRAEACVRRGGTSQGRS